MLLKFNGIVTYKGLLITTIAHYYTLVRKGIPFYIQTAYYYLKILNDNIRPFLLNAVLGNTKFNASPPI